MTLKQKVLKAFYPVLMAFSKKPQEKSVLSGNGVSPAMSIYSLSDTLNNGQPFNFEQLKGKKILLVNTASNCGYTAQYDALEELNKKFQDKLTIIGFPANDFNEQEKGDDKEIETFCRVNFGVTFRLMKKSEVKRSAGQNKIYQWLTDSTRNGWNNKQPEWNFTKYLVDENGKLVHYFAPAISPMDEIVLKAIGE